MSQAPDGRRPLQNAAAQGGQKHDFARLFDFEDPENDDRLVVNQFTIQELKNPGGENATVWGAFNQLQTYEQQIPSLFTFNEVLVVSDGTSARHGTLSSNEERSKPWRTTDGVSIAPQGELELEVLIAKHTVTGAPIRTYDKHFGGWKAPNSFPWRYRRVTWSPTLRTRRSPSVIRFDSLASLGGRVRLDGHDVDAVALALSLADSGDASVACLHLETDHCEGFAHDASREWARNKRLDQREESHLLLVF